MNRTYELMFIVRPDMADEDLDKLISTLENQVNTTGGTVKSVERMGKRRLAYVVRRFQDGMYILLTVEGTGALIHELERRLRVTEPVIRSVSTRSRQFAMHGVRHPRLRQLRKPAARHQHQQLFSLPIVSLQSCVFSLRTRTG